MLTAITGINWGDEGKGRMVDLISQEYDIVARYQGGNNAGHTVKNERGKFVLNLLPSGILRPNVVCVMGNGMVIDPHHLDGEINKLREQGIDISPANLKISDRATITMPYHVEQDGLEEARLSKTGAQFGSTKRGIAYTYGDKYMKKTLRMGDLLHLDDSVRKRLVTMVDSKNLVMEGSYNAARHRLRHLPLHHFLQHHRRLRPHRRRHPEPQADQLRRRHEGLFLLRRRRPLCH